MTHVTRRSVLIGTAALMAAPPVLARRLPSIGRVVRLDPDLDMLIDATSPVEVIATGLRWAEGPVWVPRGQFLLFSDVPANIVYRWTPTSGMRPFLDPSGLAGPIPTTIREAGANGLAIDATGGLVIANSGARRVDRLDLATHRRTILADRFEGKRFNSCNDVAIAHDGAIYFTDPPYGLADGDASPAKELSINGVYRRAPDGSVHLIDATLRRPNGIALSRDGGTLYVSCSDEKVPEIRAYRIARDGSVSESRRLVDFSADLAAGAQGLPDGLKVAPTGHLFASGPGGIHVIAPTGRRIGLIKMDKVAANCAFDVAGKRLFIAASDSIASLRLR